VRLMPRWQAGAADQMQNGEQQAGSHEMALRCDLHVSGGGAKRVSAQVEAAHLVGI
jgi:hypothetical protein